MEPVVRRLISFYRVLPDIIGFFSSFLFSDTASEMSAVTDAQGRRRRRRRRRRRF